MVLIVHGACCVPPPPAPGSTTRAVCGKTFRVAVQHNVIFGAQPTEQDFLSNEQLTLRAGGMLWAGALRRLETTGQPVPSDLPYGCGMITILGHPICQSRSIKSAHTMAFFSCVQSGNKLSELTIHRRSMLCFFHRKQNAGFPINSVSQDLTARAFYRWPILYLIECNPAPPSLACTPPLNVRFDVATTMMVKDDGGLGRGAAQT